MNSSKYWPDKSCPYAVMLVLQLKQLTYRSNAAPFFTFPMSCDVGLFKGGVYFKITFLKAMTAIVKVPIHPFLLESIIVWGIKRDARAQPMFR